MGEENPRAHSSCEWCRKGWALTGSRHCGSNVGARGIAGCTAQCSICLGAILQGARFRVIRTPAGEVEVHETCLR